MNTIRPLPSCRGGSAAAHRQRQPAPRTHRLSHRVVACLAATGLTATTASWLAGASLLL